MTVQRRSLNIADAFYNVIADLPLVYADLEATPPGATLRDDPSVPDPARTSAAVEFFRATLGDLDTMKVTDWESERDRDGQLVGEHLTVDLGPELSADIDGAVESLDIRKFTFFLAVHLMVLGCLTGSTRVTVEIPLSNCRRNRDPLKAYGYDVNRLPLSVDLAQFERFEALCVELEHRVGSLIEFEDFDFSAHARTVFAEAGAAQSRPSSSFTFYRQRQLLQLPGYEFSAIELNRSRLIVPFMANVEENSGGYTYHIQSSPRVSQSRPHDVLRTVLAYVAVRPWARLSDVPWVSPAELRRISELSGPRADFTISQSLTHCFEVQAERTPHSVAVAYENGYYTYDELNRHANQVASWIRTHVTSDFVGVSMEQSLDLITILLGVLKAGKAYVPIDPASPPQRVAAIVSRLTQLPVLVGKDALRETADLTRIDVRPVLRDAATLPSHNFVGADRRDDPAYVIFTSGSTGTPKGVVVTHANVLRLFTAACHDIDLRADYVWALFHSYAFDFAVWEMFGALLHGGRLEVVPEWTRSSPADFADFLVDRQVTILTQTPSEFRKLSQAMTADHARSLAVRTVILGGEALRFESLDRWIELYGYRAELINQYGPTETTCFVTQHRVTAEDLQAKRSNVIGRPLTDMTVTVVDADLRPVPVGVAGEMLVSGPGLARGYLGQPGQTAQRFVKVPFSEGIHYRSGDLARREVNGDLVYLGRNDQQVQLRGVRIELGEVEAALLSIGDVQECAVRLDDHDADEPELVAFVVESAPSTDARLRMELRERLPSNMRPARFVRLAQLPLTVNGKVADKLLLSPDRSAELPVAEATALACTPGDAQATPPDTAVVVRAAWTVTLGRTDFGDTEAFFDAGGTSMQLVRLLEQLRAAVPIPDLLEMVDLFEFTTVRTQADHLDRLRRQHRAAT
jgi:amino acid adenylation domain-containing protein